MTIWPKQSEMNGFYGNPTGRAGMVSPAWVRRNLVRIRPPYQMTYAGKPITAITVHRQCADSLFRILSKIKADHTAAELTASGARIFGGCFNYRLMRTSNRLSIHSWGAAIDLDPARNGLGDQTPNFANWPKIVSAFEGEGWVWGGRWSTKDGMHFQAARVG